MDYFRQKLNLLFGERLRFPAVDNLVRPDYLRKCHFYVFIISEIKFLKDHNLILKAFKKIVKTHFKKIFREKT